MEKSHNEENEVNVSKKLLDELEKLRNSKIVVITYSEYASMSDEDLETVYEVLKESFKEPTKKLEVVLTSTGGGAGVAYGLVKLLRKYCSELNAIIPRKAKSGATLFCLGCDKIFMSEIAELGPIDPMVTHPYSTDIMIPARCSIHFIESVLPEIRQLIPHEYFLKIDYNHISFCMMSVEQGRRYAIDLLTNYHFKDRPNRNDLAKEVVKRLTGYPSHDFFIDFIETQNIGLNVDKIDDLSWEKIWQIYRIHKQKLNEIMLIVETTKSLREVKKPRLTLW